MSFSDTDFFLQQREAERGWMQPVALALLFHLVTFALTYGLPQIFDRKPILDEVVTVNLVSMPDTAPPAPAPPAEAPPVEQAPPPEPPPPAKLEPVTPKVAVPPPVPQEAVEAPAPVKPVSLQPLKKKVQKADPAKLAQEQERRQQELERQKALAAARAAEERARLEAERARSALAEMIRQRGVQQTASAARRSSGGREVQSIVLQQYLIALQDRVQQFWILPDMRQWDPALETVVVLTIRPDGTVAETLVEKKSTDPFFDQFVMKTVQNASPLPRFPKLMKESSIEVGLRFRPGGVVTM
ncbi:MAG: TonB family protein [Desulfobulbaceae bacterium]|nr:TonB family protein [Desulfobulbaceae bacterium]MDY0350412.1 TonB family protein [Desulfobulbaceae bacterium]